MMSKMGLRLINSALRLSSRIENYARDFSIYLLFAKARINHRSGNIPVFIASYPKSGTTWMQNIVYQVLSDGDLSFHHIDDVSPFLEHAYSLGVQDQCIGKPVKTHLPYRSVPKSGSKYIYVYREGRDVAKSFYHHVSSFMMFRESKQTFLKTFLAGKVSNRVIETGWFDHVAEWFDNRYGLDILFVGYHELKEDLPKQIRRVAEFLGASLSAEKIKSIASTCTFEYMKSHEYKFRLGPGVGRPPGQPAAPTSFVRAGEVGGGHSFMSDEETQEYLRLARQKIPAHVLNKLGL